MHALYEKTIPGYFYKITDSASTLSVKNLDKKYPRNTKEIKVVTINAKKRTIT